MTFFSSITTLNENDSQKYSFFSIFFYFHTTFNYTLFKGYSQHTVAADAEPLGEVQIPVSINHEIEELVEAIIAHQKSNPRYDYASNEQLEIDRLVYEAYGLNADDIREVENWYARRYPPLAAAQRANLERKLAAEAEA